MIAHIDFGSEQQGNSPEFFISAHQTKERIDVPINNKNVAIFDHLDLRKHYAEIDSARYPPDSLLMNYEENDYFEQYKNVKLVFEEYVGEPMFNRFISYPDIKTKYPIGIIDLRRQPDHTAPKQTQSCKEDGTNPDNARLFLLLIRRREIELIGNGNKFLEIKGI